MQHMQLALSTTRSMIWCTAAADPMFTFVSVLGLRQIFDGLSSHFEATADCSVCLWSICTALVVLRLVKRAAGSPFGLIQAALSAGI